MAWIIGDGFDLYSTITDAALGHWDGATTASLTTGRFSPGKAITSNGAGGTVYLVKSSGTNDVTHHIVCGFVQPQAIGGTTPGLYFQLLDGTTSQCSICFRIDGAIILTSGSPSGTILATFANAFQQNVWAAFEFEVSIGASTTFKVRRNGDLTDTFVATGLNTKPGANAYANKLQVGCYTTYGAGFQKLDDILWFNTTGASPNTWVGDVRSYWQAPTTDVQTQFSALAQSVSVGGITGTTAVTAGTVRYMPFISTFTGNIGSVVVQASTAATVNVKAAIYDALGTSGAPGNLVGTVSATLTSVVAGANTLTWSTPVPVAKGGSYYVAVDQDNAVTWKTLTATAQTGTQSFASFPASFVGSGTTSGQTGIGTTISIAPTVNAQEVLDTVPDGDASYIYGNTVGTEDIYNITSLPTTPASIVATQIRCFSRKSDTGARTGAVEIKSGSSVAGTTINPISTDYTFSNRVDTVDPATGVAWTASAVNNVKLGIKITA